MVHPSYIKRGVVISNPGSRELLDTLFLSYKDTRSGRNSNASDSTPTERVRENKKRGKSGHVSTRGERIDSKKRWGQILFYI